MGLTKAENSPGLSFELDKPRQHYSPGDLISGRVLLNTAADSAIGKIAVSFWGRAKSRIIQQHGQSVTYHRGRTLLFKQEQILYEGQYTHKPGSFFWPFEFVVPEQADPACILSGEKWKPKEHYRSTVDNDRLDLTLPASNFHRRHMFGRQADCFIEYVLEVNLTEPEGLHHIRKAQTKTSTYPIIFHPLSTPEPIQNYNFVGNERLFTISTLKLLPEHAGTSLGIRDRARSIFQRDTIPKFSFSVTVQAPGIIQLFHPKPIPFLISARPDLSSDNTTIDYSTGLPEVILRSAKIELKAYVRCRASGTFADSKSYEIPILSSKPLNVPLKFSRGSIAKEDVTLDLGPLCDLRLGNAKLGSRLEAPLCPNFNTYNVARTYHLTWELELECAEKTEKFASARTGPECTVILPPATVSMEPMDPNTLLGADLAQSTSVASSGSGSAGFWSRRRSGESRSGGGSEREKEKATFGPPSSTLSAGVSALGLGDKKDKKPKSKEEEAAEDRARARPEFHSGYENPFSTAADADSDDDDGNGTSTAITQASRPGGAGTDQQLPRYAP
ncbi:uncharacterized protein Z518_06277 [Rhinocladiella mackenziei CBS 650.93]|uniref:Arrestin-like N-terminal domain-containing protein n=1 Tax=Rhinocladiella mackenziei CBS 650.93 TaxID=1442369 RepID=A0A0D2J8I2_9EURO|nr:uncharacterized protein Z518_06277 [Rhinocladiella mackenziei CBS 650.93]KIX05405.1 hypothetical protein Z518_06277 [Rhinocladiella mackenziei CBS 650.93]